MGKTYKFEAKIDLRSLKNILFGKVKCKNCGSKMKMSKEKIYQGHGTTEMGGYVDNIEGSPIHLRKNKLIFINQDIYEIKYSYVCCNCKKVYRLDEV